MARRAHHGSEKGQHNVVRSPKFAKYWSTFKIISSVSPNLLLLNAKMLNHCLLQRCYVAFVYAYNNHLDHFAAFHWMVLIVIGTVTKKHKIN